MWWTPEKLCSAPLSLAFQTPLALHPAQTFAGGTALDGLNLAVTLLSTGTVCSTVSYNGRCRVSSHGTVSLQESFRNKVNMEPERGCNQCVDEDSSKEKSDTSLSATSKAESPASSSGDSLSSLLPKALSAVLHHTLPPGQSRNQPTSENSTTSCSQPLNLEQLQTELTVLRGQFEQMKSQHNKEIKQLMNELDEEKKIRLTLQMEIKRIKKHMSK
ncbi:SH3 domain-containing kinase-binding protein 1 [Periophthalmus magnuspinnatus]|uniref:SH3 domain-containing kinase-binding protein 1 n=1 Tax=Periophthalmus magnuspinnatus TaxID=409849 RepID=UPI0024362D59|nr:SH3 domain-containing kinase-binding protein 1 [Periophthalmus magnuspinnatus]